MLVCLSPTPHSRSNPPPLGSERIVGCSYLLAAYFPPLGAVLLAVRIEDCTQLSLVSSGEAEGDEEGLLERPASRPYS